jgi:hypothetical protein
MESVFVHITVVPAATVTSSGVKALFPSDWAPTGIATAAEGAPGVGVGDGVVDGEAGDDEELPPQAIATIRIADTTPRRNETI